MVLTTAVDEREELMTDHERLQELASPWLRAAAVPVLSLPVGAVYGAILGIVIFFVDPGSPPTPVHLAALFGIYMVLRFTFFYAVSYLAALLAVLIVGGILRLRRLISPGDLGAFLTVWLVSFVLGAVLEPVVSTVFVAGLEKFTYWELLTSHIVLQALGAASLLTAGVLLIARLLRRSRRGSTPANLASSGSEPSSSAPG